MKLKADSFPPPGEVDTTGVPTSIFGGIVLQLKKTPLSGVAQENSTILPSLIFLDSGVTDNNTALLPT